MPTTTIHSQNSAPRRPVRQIWFFSAAMLVSVLVFAPVANAQSAQSSQTGQNSQGPLSLQSSLKFGARGSAVVALQQALITRGVAVVGGADGIFGKATRKALKTFQSNNELIPDGQLNSTTAYLLGLGPIPTLPQRGQRGIAVTQLQQALINSSVSFKGGADGIFGGATAAAITAFQTSHGIKVTGVVNLTTAIALGLVPGSRPLSVQPTTTTTVTPTTTTVAPTTTTVAPTTTTTVPIVAVFAAVGQTGENVKTLQKALLTSGVTLRGGADGKFGSATTAAIKEFQTALRIASTGIVDQLTAQLLGLVAGPAFPKLGDSGSSVAKMQTLLLGAAITVPGGADGKFGPATQKAIAAYQRTQGFATTGIVDLLTALALGVIPGRIVTSVPTTSTSVPPTTTPPALPALKVIVFPVLGPCWFGDTWQAPRSGGRQHQGVDIIAKSGTPLYAANNGRISRQSFDRVGSLGGNTITLTAADGTYFYYAHLSTFADGIAVGSEVVAGQVIGYVGSTGSSSTPHLHFEYHPYGGAAVNPYPAVKAVDGCKTTTPPTTIPPTTTIAPTTTNTPKTTKAA